MIRAPWLGSRSGSALLFVVPGVHNSVDMAKPSGRLRKRPNARTTLGPWIGAGIAVAGIAVALAIGFHHVRLSNYQLRLAQFVATLLGGVGLIISALRYIWERQEELAWEKTKFMVDLFGEFEKEPRFRRAQELMDTSVARKDESFLEHILGSLDGLSREEQEDRRSIDRYLDFFDHLYTYIFITKTLSPEDVISFSGYVIDILDSPAVSGFAFDWGYEDVLRLGIHFRDRAFEAGREAMIEELRREVAVKRGA